MYPGGENAVILFFSWRRRGILQIAQESLRAKEDEHDELSETGTPESAV